VRLATLEAIAGGLARGGVRYLVVGGVAVNAHGHLRLTNDLDLVIRLDPSNVREAFAALAALGYRPTVPVRAEQFADPVQRESWIRDKGMQVLSFWSEAHKETAVDLFVTEPFDFDEEHASAFTSELAPGLVVRFIRLEALIRMKEVAGRPRDLDDAEHLRSILEDRAQ
jgi:hypothetical protein